MTFLTDQEQLDLLEENPSTSQKIETSIIKALRTLGVLEKLDAAIENAEKAWKMAKRIDKRQEEILEADLRSQSARANTFRAESVSKG